MPSVLSSPVYQLPLTDDELLIVGRITLAWAQIDFQIDGVLTALHRLDDEQFTAFFGRMTIGGKVQAVRVALKRAPSETAHTSLTEMCDAISECLADRNLMTHGMWGWNWDAQNARWESCAISHRKGQAFSASELPNLHEKVVLAAVKADHAYSRIVFGTEPAATRNRTYASSPFPPETAPGGMPPRYIR